MSGALIATPSPLRGWAKQSPAPHRGPIPQSAVKALANLKAEYSAALPSRFRRTRNGLGGLADAHMLSGQQFWAVREYARDMDRNDALFGQLVDRAVDMRVGGGPTPRPQTGDKDLDGRLFKKWRRWAGNPFACDLAKRRAFPELARAWERAKIVDGDMFVAFDDARGAIQSVEGDHVDSPMTMGGDLFHGVKIDSHGAPLEYHFVDASDSARFAHVIYYAVAHKHSARPAFDENGDPVVLHIFDPARLTQTRGITAFHAVFDYLGMVEDTNYAALVKQQMASMVMGFLESNWDVQLGTRTEETNDDSTLKIIQEMQPGAMFRGPPGTKLTAFTPNIPGSDFLEHMQFMARVLGGALHLPIEIVLMDYSRGNFSSQRMAIDQARQAVVFGRQSSERLVYQHIWNWKARAWLLEEGIDARERPEALDHAWRWTGFPYHDKQADATADKIRVDNLQITRRDLAQENGQDWDDLQAEAIEDGGAMIAAAMAKAREVSTPEHPVTWEQVLGLATPAGVTTTQTKADPKQLEAQKEAADQKGRADTAEAALVVAAKRAEVSAVAGECVRKECTYCGNQVCTHYNCECHKPECRWFNEDAPKRETAEALAALGQEITRVRADLDRFRIEASARPAITIHNAPPAVTFTAPVDARTTISEGAVHVSAPVDARSTTTIAEGAVAVTTQPGAVTVTSKVTADVNLPSRPARTATITAEDGTTSTITIDGGP